MGVFFVSQASQDLNKAAVHSTVSNQPSGLLLSLRVPTLRNVYQERAIPRMGVFFASQASQDLNALISSIILREL